MRNFEVRVRWDGQVVAGVSRVTPVRSTVEVVTLREGGGGVYKLPGRADCPSVTLERGVTEDLGFDLWASGPPLRKDVELELVDASDQLIVLYRLHRCWVSEYAVVPDVETGMAIESISLSVDSWERVKPAASVLAKRLATERTGVVRTVKVASLLTGSRDEAERHLATLLAEAEEAGAVLLLDEADALFATRTEVDDAHDRYEPTDVEALLDGLAGFRGQVLVVPPHEE